MHGLRVPRPEAEQRLRLELAVALCQQEVLVSGPAAELAEISREHFVVLLGSRGLPRHYSDEDVSRDVTYARGE